MTKHLLLHLICLLGVCTSLNCEEPKLSCNYSTLKAKALEDLKFIEKTLLENHPGVYNTEDPNFVQLVKNGYESAVSQVDKLKSDDDYITLLQTYAKSFNDGHLGIKATNQKSPEKKNERSFSIEEVSPDITWITLPIFSPSKEQQVQLKEIINKMPSLRSKKKIVFDLRGNTGGNSEWGNEILSALFTKQYTKEKWYEAQKSVNVDWFVSDGNIEHVKNLLDSFQNNFGTNNEAFQAISKTYQGMLAAKAKGEHYYLEASPKPQEATQHAPNPVSAQIVLVIDRKCASACLDFIDNIKALKHNTVLVGEQTTADTFYLEIRHVVLPSGLADLWFPIKVYRNRPRGNNEPYLPNLSYPGDLNNTPALKKWLQTQLG